MQLEGRARPLRSMYRDVRAVARHLERYYEKHSPRQAGPAGGFVHPALLGDGLHAQVAPVVEDHVLPLPFGDVLAQGVGILRNRQNLIISRGMS